jgi:hypothetical protein
MDKATKQLFDAARAGDVDDVRAAIRAGADINAKDKHGDTPLHSAALLSRVSAVQELLKNGANRTITNARGFTAEEEMLIPIKAIFTTRPNANLGPAGRVPDVEAAAKQKRAPGTDYSGQSIQGKIAELFDPIGPRRHAGRVSKARSDKGPPQVGG